MSDKSTPWGTPSLCMAAVKQQLLQLLGMGDTALMEQALVTGHGTARLPITNHMEKIKSFLNQSPAREGLGCRANQAPWSCTVHSKPPCFHWPGRSLGRQYKLPLAEEEAKGPAALGHLNTLI